MRYGVCSIPDHNPASGDLCWLAWLESERGEIVASSYHRTREAAESAARWLRPRGRKDDHA